MGKDKRSSRILFIEIKNTVRELFLWLTYRRFIVCEDLNQITQSK
jgi:hypothetical protein